MTDTIIVSLISAGASVVVAVTALVLNYCGFSSIDARIGGIDTRIGSLESRIDARLSSMQNDLKEFYKLQGDHDLRISKLEDKK